MNEFEVVRATVLLKSGEMIMLKPKDGKIDLKFSGEVLFFSLPMQDGMVRNLAYPLTMVDHVEYIAKGRMKK